ncbi:MAG: winged helix-turn-helix transcriptional regulator [Pararhodobacter sp.]|nr:winged helix-turn-helix transcriptional regulator [Pararhodobacter sp.]
MGRIAASQDPFRAVADPGRRRMLDAMLTGERSVGALTQMLEISQPAVSQHLQVLKQAGLVTERKAGRNRYYQVNGPELQIIADWLGKYEIFWNDKLGALNAHLARRKQ